MSLVNDMLRDLDQRKGEAGNPPQIPLTASAKTDPAKSRWGLIGGLAVAVVGASAWMLLSTPDQAEFVVQPRARTPVVAPPAERATPAVTNTAAPKGAPATQTVPKAAAVPEQAVTSPGVEAVATVSEPAAAKVEALVWQQTGEELTAHIEIDRAVRFSLRRITGRDLLLALPQSQLHESFSLPEAPGNLSLSLDRDSDDLLLRLSSEQPVNFQVSRTPGGLSLNVRPRQMPVASTPTVAEKPPEQKTGAEAPDLPATPAAMPSRSDVTPAFANGVSPSAVAQPIAAVKKQQGQSVEQLDRRQVSKAVALIRKGREADAQRQLQQFVMANPHGQASRALLATLLLAQNRADQAEPLLSTGLELSPQDAELRKLKARLLIQRGETAPAVALLEPAAPTLELDPEYHQLHAAALQASGDHQAAAERYRALLGSDATQPSWWVGLGVSLEALARTGEARQAYRNVLRIPGSPAALTDYAQRRLQRLGG